MQRLFHRTSSLSTSHTKQIPQKVVSSSTRLVVVSTARKRRSNLQTHGATSHSQQYQTTANYFSTSKHTSTNPLQPSRSTKRHGTVESASRTNLPHSRCFQPFLTTSLTSSFHWLNNSGYRTAITSPTSLATSWKKSRSLVSFPRMEFASADSTPTTKQAFYHLASYLRRSNRQRLKRHD